MLKMPLFLVVLALSSPARTQPSADDSAPLRESVDRTDAPGAPPSAVPPWSGRTALGPGEIPPSSLSYTMRARLAPASRKVTGRAVIKWTVPGETPVQKVPLHLYLNAFANEASTWISGAALRRDFDIGDQLEHFDDPWGYIVMERIEQVYAPRQATSVPREAAAGAEGSPVPTGDGAASAAPPPPAEPVITPLTYVYIAPDDQNAADRTLAEVTLARAVAPGETLELHIRFSSRLPVPIARTGGHSGYFHVAQWFPKLGMYETKGIGGASADGFDARQFHGPTEFYAEFADYDVTLDVPRGYQVVATGTRPDDPEHQADDPALPGAGSSERSEVRYTQSGVHDFAWVASNRIVVEREVYDPDGPGGPIELSYVVPREGAPWIERMRRATRATFDVLGRRVGPYPYTSMKVVFPTQSAMETSGMEYPTLVTGLPGDPLYAGFPLGDLDLAESVTAHEITHNYFYGLVASNEQEDAFLDEGFTQFWESQILAEMDALPDGPKRTLLGFPLDRTAANQRNFTKVRDKIVEPVTHVPAALYFPGAHGTQIYGRSWGILNTVRRHFGAEVIDRIFSTYFARYRFAHPVPADFFAVVDEVAPEASSMVREQYGLPFLPDFSVDAATSEEVHGARGVHFQRGQSVESLPAFHTLSDEQRSVAFRLTDEGYETESGRSVGVPELAPAGEVLLWRTDPADIGGPRPRGEVKKMTLPLVAGGTAWGGIEPADDADGAKVQRSYVRVRGPALRHLSTEVQFVFTDNTVARDVWPAHNAWRSYEFYHDAPLYEVRIDPDAKIIVDANVENNGVRLEPNNAAASAVSGLVTALVQWIAMGVTWWL